MPYAIKPITSKRRPPQPINSPDPMMPDLETVEAELARRKLRTFVDRVWHLVEPTVEFKPNWHIDQLCGALEDVTKGKHHNIIINVPPGCMKSLLVSVIWPAWEWATNPALRYFTASYGGHLTIRDNLRLRSIITSPWYQKHFALRMKGDQNEKVWFNTIQGGWRVASSVGGRGTGEHPDRVIIDDPLTAEQGRSAIERANANSWYDSTISSRGLSRGARVVIIMQRLHEDDLAGHLLARGGWHHICWPMRYEWSNDRSKSDPLDKRSAAGELLYPGLFPEPVVRKLELDLGPYGTASQLQQRPAPEGGGLFKRDWFKIVDVMPTMAQRVRGWDTAATEGAGDYTVGVRMSRVGSMFYIEDVVRGQLSPHGVDSLMLRTSQLDSVSCKQREEREGGSAGKAVADSRAKTLVGYDYRSVTLGGDKVTRAGPFRSQVEAGNVALVKAPWNETYLNELCTFPTGKHDDQVDASSCAFNSLLLEPNISITLEPPTIMPRDSPWQIGRGSVTNPALGYIN